MLMTISKFRSKDIRHLGQDATANDEVYDHLSSNYGHRGHLPQQKSVSTPARIALSRGDLLRRLRMRRQISQSKLARKAGMSSSAVQQIEADMREGRGTHPDNAAALLRVLDAMEPLTDQELAEFIEYFPVREDVVEAMLHERRTASMFTSKSPEERARYAIDILRRLVGEEEMAQMLESIAIAAHETARRAREAATGRPQPSITQERWKTLVRTLERDGMRIEERIPHTASGRPLVPVPAGQGVIDDPDLSLAEQIDALTAQLGKGTPRSELPPPMQSFLADVENAVKRARRTNTG